MEEDLKTWVKKAAQADKLALDTETTGLDPLKARLVGISRCLIKTGAACLYPGWASDPGRARQQLTLEIVASIWRGLF